jgi:tetratricopeptide (TPR) repeat protein
MKKLALFISVLIVVALLGFITYKFGVIFLLRLVFGVGYALLAVIFGILFAVMIYARSKYSLLGLIALLSSFYAAYQCIVWSEPLHVLWITVGYLFTLAVSYWWILEPDLTLSERLKSPKSLEKSGNWKAAARKYEKRGNYIEAAECYLKAGMKESAAWCYEKAKEYAKAAEIYEKLAGEQDEDYYWKEAREMWLKAGDELKAVECLEKYAENEPWFWEDVAEGYEKLNKKENAEKAWKRALDYYIKEAQEEGVFWEDVAKIYEKLGDTEKAKDAMLKFAKYCEKEAEEDEAWWKHVAEAYEKLGDTEKAKEARKRYEEYRKRVQSGITTSSPAESG